MNHSFGYGEVLTATIVLLGVMVALAWWWDRLRNQSQPLKRRIEIGVAIGLALVFFFGPGE